MLNSKILLILCMFLASTIGIGYIAYQVLVTVQNQANLEVLSQ